MAITLSNTSVNEATDGIQIGTLSTDQGSGTFSLYFSNHSNFLTLSGTTLSLKSGWFLDFESKYFISNTSTHSNGLISSRSYSSWKTTTNDGDDPIQKGKIRKLSMTISLNDGTEYDGGQLQFDYKNVSFDEWTNEKIESSKVACHQIFKKGSIVVFPSFLWHRVTPVTRGTRYSLVAWNWGWPFQ